MWYYVPDEQERGDALPVLIVPKESEGGNKDEKPDVH